MKKKLSTIFALLFSIASWGQTSFTATYTFGSDGNVSSFEYNGTIYEGIALSNIDKTGITSSSNADNFRATNWPRGATNGSDVFTGTMDAGKYIGFTISAKEGYKFTVGSITFGIGRSNTGIRQSEWRGSSDAYSSTINNYTSLNAGLINNSGVLTNPDSDSNWTGNVLEPGESYANVNSSVGFRLFLYNSEISAGTAGLQGAITIKGTFGETTPSINISASTALSESNLHNAEISLTLSNETFVASLQPNFFTLNNAPSGTTIQSVSRDSSSGATITLAFDETDFDEDVTNFNITANSDALTGDTPLTSNNLTIAAHTSPLAVTNAATGTFNGNATLNGTVTSQGYTTTVTFEYSNDANISTGILEVTATQDPLAADAVSTAVSCSLSGLTNGLNYYYRVKAANSEGTSLGAIQSFKPAAPPTLFISEVTHPNNAANAKYVELYNYGSESIDLSAASVFLARQTNGGTINSITLNSTIAPYSTFVIAGNEAVYKTNFLKAADIYSGTVDGNGNDGYFLYALGNHTTGTLFDSYGVLNENGTGKLWEYTNSKAVRKVTVNSPNPAWTSSEWVVVNSSTERMSPGMYPASVWNGSTSNSWNDASNWDNGTPSATTDIVIWGGSINFPELTTETTVRNIVINHNAQLNGQEHLTINGNTQVLHQIEFSESHANLNRWQYFTSPFTDLTAGGMLTSNNRVDVYLAEYVNTIEGTIHDAWNWLELTTTPITPGKGFATTAVYDISETGDVISTTYYNMTITGTLFDASTSASVNLNYLGPELNNNNWNLIGNPYLSTIDWFADTHLDYSKIQGKAAYIYKPVTGTYITLTSTGSGSGTVSPTGTQFIPPMQGFFVKAIGSGNVEINTNARANGKQGFYKSGQLLSTLRIQFSSDSLFDETVVFYNEMADEVYDPYDADKMLTMSRVPQIYSRLDNGQKLVFNHTNTLEKSIALQAITSNTGTYTLKLAETGLLFNDYFITLTDHTNSQSVVISDVDYQFENNDQDKVYNFTLNFQERTSTNLTDLIDLKVFVINNQVIIQSRYDHTGKAIIYDLTGKIIAEHHVSGYRSVIDLKNGKGWFIIRLTGVNGTSCHKLVSLGL